MMAVWAPLVGNSNQYLVSDMRQCSYSYSLVNRCNRNPVWLLRPTLVGRCHPLRCYEYLIKSCWLTVCLLCFRFCRAVLFHSSFVLPGYLFPPPCVRVSHFLSILFLLHCFLSCSFIYFFLANSPRLACLCFALVFIAVGVAWPNHLAVFAKQLAVNLWLLICGHTKLVSLWDQSGHCSCWTYIGRTFQENTYCKVSALSQ